jgi:endoglucanase
VNTTTMTHVAPGGALGRGINLGGAHDGGSDDGGWLEERHFDAVRDAGFDTVRLPVKWSAHAGASPPYSIERSLFERVDRAVERALRRALNVVLDVYHYDELCADRDRHAPRFLALWAQIAQRYAGAGPRLCFELLNEPHAPMTAPEWNELLASALAVVRASNPERLGMSWAYCDLASDFGTFDVGRHAWRPPLKQALLGR